MFLHFIKKNQDKNNLCNGQGNNKQYNNNNNNNKFLQSEMKLRAFSVAQLPVMTFWDVP